MSEFVGYKQSNFDAEKFKREEEGHGRICRWIATYHLLGETKMCEEMQAEEARKMKMQARPTHLADGSPVDPEDTLLRNTISAFEERLKRSDTPYSQTLTDLWKEAKSIRMYYQGLEEAYARAIEELEAAL